MIDLHDLKSLGYHQLRNARENNTSSAVPMMFVGGVSVMLGVTMLMKGYSEQAAAW